MQNIKSRVAFFEKKIIILIVIFITIHQKYYIRNSLVYNRIYKKRSIYKITTRKICINFLNKNTNYTRHSIQTIQTT